MNKLQRLTVGLNLADLEKAGQFEEHGPLAALPNLKLQRGVGIEAGGRRDYGANLILRNADRLRFRLFAHDPGGIAGTAARMPQSERTPDVVVALPFDRLQLPRPDLFRLIESK